MNKVKCNNCEWTGQEKDLKQFQDEKGGGFGCPVCKTDAFLCDVKSTTVEKTAERCFHNPEICSVCKTPLIVGNWYDRETLASVVDEPITEKEFEMFQNFLNGAGFYDEINGILREYFWEFNKRK